MKTRVTIISSFLLILFLFTACQSETKPESLDEDINEIEKIAERSENIQNKEDAFALIRDLNQNLKKVRDKILELDNKYNNASDAEKKSMERKFENQNKEINRHLKIISKNIEPYKEKKEVAKMLKKLNEIMITK
ncbi:MAG: hypothetical protein ACQES1_08615 [Bacteroidota bacterium]